MANCCVKHKHVISKTSFGVPAKLEQKRNHVYLIIKSFELSFEKYADSPTVFEDTQVDLLQNNHNVSWNCKEHKSEFLTEMFLMYITMRMRQHSYNKNIEAKQYNKTKKKLSKLVTS